MLFCGALTRAGGSQLAKTHRLGGAAQVLDDASGLIWPVHFCAVIQQVLDLARRSQDEEAAEAAWQ